MFSRLPVVRSLSILAAAALFSFAFAPGLHASVMNKKTIVTVNTPVQIPGQVLHAGTYSLSVLPDTGGNVVEVRNHETGQFIAFVMATPTWREATPTKTIVTVGQGPAESASDTTPALAKWFYPGYNTGLKFSYPQHQPALAKAKTTQSHAANG